jgi:hypothetical protein
LRCRRRAIRRSGFGAIARPEPFRSAGGFLSKPLVEAMMKALLMFAVTASLLAGATLSHAQSAGGDQDKGVTNGWSAGTKDQSIPGGGNHGAGVHDEAEAQNQPAMATGLDLNGPPMKFPPSKTPE